MNVILKSFCEDVPLADPKNVKSYLVFEQDGVEFRVPVGTDAIQAIVRHVYKVPSPVASIAPVDVAQDPDLADEAQEPEPTDATVFGGADEEDPDELPPDDNEDPIGALELKRVEVDTEDGIPSL